VWMRASTETRPVVAPPAVAVDASRPGPAPATLAAHGATDVAAAQPVQLVFRAPAATRVRVVGDFTGWDAGAAPMVRDPASGLWSVTLAVRPGRHVYAFLVDDSIWVRDPRAPVAADADFQRPGSLLLVGRP
jgi:1,4-alpha-glucan branching enzyme